MALRKGDNSPAGGKVLVILFILAAAFLIVGGCLLLAIGKEPVGAAVCIGIGALGLVFFGTGLFMMTHPGSRLATGFLIGLCVLVCGGLVAVVFSSISNYMLLQPILDLEHYLQVWENPVTVTAIVTDHDSYDDEGDTDYRSYVTYDYNNVRYKDYPYENRDKEEDLTPLGEAVTIQISPKDPTRQISELKRSSFMVAFIWAWIFGGLAALYAWTQRRKLTESGAPTTEIIVHDIKMKVRSRVLRPFLLFCWVGYGLFYWRYSVATGIFPLVIAGICALVWLICMYTAIRDYRRAENQDFELRRDVLIEKKEISDSDGTAYILQYRSGDRTWKVSATEAVYRRSRVGDIITAVYLPRKSKPIVHYGRFR